MTDKAKPFTTIHGFNEELKDMYSDFYNKWKTEVFLNLRNLERAEFKIKNCI